MRLAAYLDKGGTGKSTSIAHFAAALVEEGHDVLAVDLAGKQNDLATIFGVVDQLDDDEDRWPNVSTVFQRQWEQVADRLAAQLSDGADDVVSTLTVETESGVDLLPAHEGLDALNDKLAAEFDDDEKYRRFDKFLDGVTGYDVILIDLPGKSDNVAYNGLWAAEHVLAPTRAGLLESDQVVQLESDLDAISETHGKDIELTMILPTMIDRRTNLSERYLTEYDDRYGDQLAPEPIPRTQDIPNLTADGQTLFGSDDEQLYTTGHRAKQAYRANAIEAYERVMT